MNFENKNMSSDSNENNTPEKLDELIGKLFPPSQAKNIKVDIAAGDNIMGKLENVPASNELLSAIKAKVSQKVEKQNSRIGFKKLASLTAAAAIVLIAIIMFNNQGQLAETEITAKTEDVIETVEVASEETRTSLWDDFETTQDTHLALLEMEIEDIASEITAEAIGSESNGIVMLSDDTDDLELEIIETDTIFWKG